MDEFVAEYSALLAQLKRNEKRDINVLSMLAEDNKQHAPAIVDAIERHILRVRSLSAPRRATLLLLHAPRAACRRSPPSALHRIPTPLTLS